jgi:hypothetical protein
VPRTGGGHLVLVSNGEDGLLRGDGNGHWVRIGSYDRDGRHYPPERLSQGVLAGGDAFFAVAVVVLLLLLAGLGVAAIKAEAPWRVSRWAVLFAVAAVVGVSGSGWVLKAGETAHPLLVVTVALWCCGALALGAAVIALYRKALHPGWVLVLLALIGLVAYQTEGWRLSGSVLGIFNEGLGRMALVIVGFVACGLTGIGTRRYPRQTG